MRDCFHFVSLFKTLSRLMHEKMFLQQNGVVSPISKVSAVNSGCSPMTHEGKSRSAMLEKKNICYPILYLIDQLNIWSQNLKRKHYKESL